LYASRVDSTSKSHRDSCRRGAPAASCNGCRTLSRPAPPVAESAAAHNFGIPPCGTASCGSAHSSDWHATRSPRVVRHVGYRPRTDTLRSMASAARMATTEPSTAAGTAGNGWHRVRWGRRMISVRRWATVTTGWWAAMIWMVMVKSTARRPHSVSPCSPSPATVLVTRPVINVYTTIAAIIVAISAVITRCNATTDNEKQPNQGAAHCHRLRTAAEWVSHCATSLLSARVHSSSPKGAPAGSAMTAVIPPWRSRCG
jgi:hypothetical protein